MKRRKANERATKRIEGGKMMQLMSRFAVATIFFFWWQRGDSWLGMRRKTNLFFVHLHCVPYAALSFGRHLGPCHLSRHLTSLSHDTISVFESLLANRSIEIHYE